MKEDDGPYAVAVKVSKEPLSPVDRTLALRYVENGRHGGAALDSATRARTTAMFQRLNDLTRDFGLTLSGDSSRITLSDSEIAPLPEQIRGRVEPRGDRKTLRVDESMISLFLRNEPSSDARRRYLHEFVRLGGEANVTRLSQAVALRDSLAHLFGFPSWAAYQLEVKVARTPQRATDFIKQIDAGLLTKARRELSGARRRTRGDAGARHRAPAIPRPPAQLRRVLRRDGDRRRQRRKADAVATPRYGLMTCSRPPESTIFRCGWAPRESSCV